MASSESVQEASALPPFIDRNGRRHRHPSLEAMAEDGSSDATDSELQPTPRRGPGVQRRSIRGSPTVRMTPQVPRIRWRVRKSTITSPPRGVASTEPTKSAPHTRPWSTAAISPGWGASEWMSPMVFQRNPIITVNFLSTVKMEISDPESRESERQNRKLCKETFSNNDPCFLKRRVAKFGSRDIDGFGHHDGVEVGPTFCMRPMEIPPNGVPSPGHEPPHVGRSPEFVPSISR
jgi:hypothetical protein